MARHCERLRWCIVVGWIGLAVASVIFLPGLSSLVSTRTGSLLPSDQPSARASMLEDRFQTTGGSQAFLVAGNTKGPLDPLDDSVISAAMAAVATVPDVRSVNYVATSANQGAGLVTVTADVPGSGQEADALVTAMRTVLDRPTIGGVDVPAGLHIDVAGNLGISADSTAANQAALRRTLLLVILFLLLLLLLIYRSWLAPLLTVLPATLALAVAGPLVAELAQHGLPVSTLTPIILSALVLGAGTSFSLFVIMRCREKLGQGVEPHQAVVAAFGGVGASVVFAAVTVSAGLCCLIVGEFGVYRGLGPSLSIAIVLMLLAALTFLPAVLAIFGRNAFWPRAIQPPAEQAGLWSRAVQHSARHRGLTLGAGVVALGLLGIGCLGLTLTGFSTSITSPTGSGSARGYALLGANFPASVAAPTDFLLVFPTSVWTSPRELRSLATAQHRLVRSPLLGDVSGPLDPFGVAVSVSEIQTLYAALGPPSALSVTPPYLLPPTISPSDYAAYRTMARYISLSGQTVQFTSSLTTGRPSSAASVAAVPKVRSLMASVAQQIGAPGSGVYGTAPVAYDIKRVAGDDLGRVLPVGILVLLLLSGLLLRSLVAPIFLLLMVGLAYVAALGLTNILFVHLGGRGGVNFVVPLLLFTFLAPWGEGINLLVMTGIRQEALRPGTEGDGPNASVVMAASATGGTVASAGLVLAGTFAVVGLAGGNTQLEELGTALALSVLLSTFTAGVLLPSLVTLFGPWAWWPSPLAQARSTGEASQLSTSHRQGP